MTFFLRWASILLLLVAAMRLLEAGDRDECSGAPSQCPADAESTCGSCGCQCPLSHTQCNEFCSAYNYDSNGKQMDCNQTSHRCEEKDMSTAEAMVLNVAVAIIALCCGAAGLSAMVYCAYKLGVGKHKGMLAERLPDPPIPTSALVLTCDGNSQVAQLTDCGPMQQLPYPPGVNAVADPLPVLCAVLSVVTVSGEGGMMIKQQREEPAAATAVGAPDGMVIATMVSCGEDLVLTYGKPMGSDGAATERTTGCLTGEDG